MPVFSLYIELWAGGFWVFFHHFKTLFHLFLTSIVSDERLTLFQINFLYAFFSLTTFRINLFTFKDNVYITVIIMYLGGHFFTLTLFGICWVSWIYKFGEVFSHYFFIIISWIAFFSPRTPMAWTFDILLLSHRSLKLFKFFNFFLSPLFKLNNFYWSIFEFTDSFCCQLHSAMEPIQLFLNFGYHIF